MYGQFCIRQAIFRAKFRASALAFLLVGIHVGDGHVAWSPSHSGQGALNQNLQTIQCTNWEAWEYHVHIREGNLVS